VNASISESSVDRADKLRAHVDWRINPGAENIIEKTPFQIKGAVADPPARAIALVNNDSIVIGIGLTGFKTSAANQTGWPAIFIAEPGSLVRAYVISSQGNEACRIPGDNVV
jgi:hypothetical protein